MQYCTSARWSVFSAPSLASPFLECFGSQEQYWLSLSRHVHICAIHAYIGRACQSRSRLSSICCIMHSIRFISFMCWPDRQVERIWLILGIYIVLQKRSKCVFVWKSHIMHSRSTARYRIQYCRADNGHVRCMTTAPVQYHTHFDLPIFVQGSLFLAMLVALIQHHRPCTKNTCHPAVGLHWLPDGTSRKKLLT